MLFSPILVPAQGPDAISNWSRIPIVLQRKGGTLGGGVTGPDGRYFWIADTSEAAALRVASNGAVLRIPLTYRVSGGSVRVDPFYATSGADGKVYLTAACGSSHGAIVTLAGTGMFVVHPTPTDFPTGNSVLGPDGNVWFAEFSHLGEIAPTGKIVEHQIPISVDTVAVGADRNIWAMGSQSSSGGAEIVRFAPHRGVLNVFNVDCYGYVNGLTRGSDGALYTTCNVYLPGSSGVYSIIRIDTSGGQSEVYNPIESGFGAQALFGSADGALWFAHPYNDTFGFFAWNFFGRYDIASGQLAEFAAPFKPGYISAVAKGPDGNVWAVDRDPKKTGAYVDVLRPLTKPGQKPAAWKRIAARVKSPAALIDIVAAPGSSPYLWYSDAADHIIVRRGLDGSVMSFRVGGWLKGKFFPYSPGRLAFGGDGRLYFGGCLQVDANHCQADSIGIMDVTGHYKIDAMPSGDGPGLTNGLGIGPDGNVWAAEALHVARITPSGSVTEFLYPNQNLPNVNSGVAAAGGRVWVPHAHDVDEFDPSSGRARSHLLSYRTCRAPSGIALAADGHLYIGCATGGYSSYEYGGIFQIAMDGTARSVPNAFGAAVHPIRGPTGAVMFAMGAQTNYPCCLAMLGTYDASADAIEAVWTPYVSPSATGANIVSIAMAADGNIWGLDTLGYLDIYSGK